MLNIWWVYKAVVAVLANLEYRIGQDYRCTKYNHRRCDIFHVCRDLIWDKNTCDNYYLTHIHYVFCCVDLKNLIRETGLWQNKCSHPDAQIFNMLHMILSVFPILFTWTFFCFLWSKIPCLSDSLDKCF